jgi:DNA-binding response OmpR family regulator
LKSLGNELSLVVQFTEWLNTNYDALVKYASESEVSTDVLMQGVLDGIMGPRTGLSGAMMLHVRDLRVDVKQREVWRNGEYIREVRNKQLDLLIHLMRHAGRVDYREDILRDIWGTGWVGSNKLLDQHMALLRKALGPDRSYISTIRGYGFRFNTEGQVS